MGHPPHSAQVYVFAMFLISSKTRRTKLSFITIDNIFLKFFEQSGWRILPLGTTGRHQTPRNTSCHLPVAMDLPLLKFLHYGMHFHPMMPCSWEIESFSWLSASTVCLIDPWPCAENLPYSYCYPPRMEKIDHVKYIPCLVLCASEHWPQSCHCPSIGALYADQVSGTDGYP